VPVDQDGLVEVSTRPNTFLHWYGKSPVRIARKMGHITVLGDDLEETRNKARAARRRISV
jgi:5-(carboxyamino)imidazole ribonucleotide synthase